MILKCSVPNNIYGCWYNVKQVAGPFGNYLLLIFSIFSGIKLILLMLFIQFVDSELVARNGSKYWSGMNESDNDTRRHGIVDNKVWIRKKLKKYASERISNIHSIHSTNSTESSYTHIPCLPTPPNKKMNKSYTKRKYCK